MLLMGDEVCRTQRGNNNAYCQDNEVSWFDWSDVERHADVHRFVRELIRLRSIRESVRVDHHLTLDQLMQRAHIRLHGVELDHPDFGESSRSLALSATSLSGDLLMYFALNSYWEPLDFQVPALPDGAGPAWLEVLNTSLPSPFDIVDPAQAAPLIGPIVCVAARSAVVLFAAGPNAPEDLRVPKLSRKPEAS